MCLPSVRSKMSPKSLLPFDTSHTDGGKWLQQKSEE